MPGDPPRPPRPRVLKRRRPARTVLQIDGSPERPATPARAPTVRVKRPVPRRQPLVRGPEPEPVPGPEMRTEPETAPAAPPQPKPDLAKPKKPARPKKRAAETPKPGPPTPGPPTPEAPAAWPEEVPADEGRTDPDPTPERPGPVTVVEDEEPEPVGYGRGFRYRYVLVPIGILVVIWLAVCGVTVAEALHDIHGGVSSADQVRGEVNTADLASTRAEGPLNQAVSHFSSAHRLLSRPWMAPLDAAPYLGRQLKAARSLSGAAETVTAAGRTSLDQTRTLLNTPHDTPAQRAQLVTRMHGVAATLSNRVNHVNLGPDNHLLPTLASKRTTFVQDLARLQTDLQRGVAATGAASDLLNGPRTYLVLAANNAEMRSGSGMYLEAGTLSSAGGNLTFGQFSPTDQLTNPASPVVATDDLARLWNGIGPTKDYRQLGATPQFPANASLAAQMWQAQTGQKIDGVLVVDVDGLRSLLSAVGSISGGGLTVTPSTVDDQLLKGQYVGLSDGADVNDARHEQLGALASAIFGAIQDPGTSVPKVASALADAANGRHLMIWSADPTVEADWLATGAGGEVTSNGMLLGVINNDGNKLDPYLDIQSKVTTGPTGANNTRVTVTATLTNKTPPGLSPYAADGTQAGLPSGSYAGTAELDFPKVAGDATVDRPAIVASGSDYSSQVLAVPVILVPGQVATVTWQFTVAGFHGSLEILPSARIPPITWTGGGRTFTDATSHAVRW